MMLSAWPRLLFEVLFLRPLVWIVLGLRIRYKQRLLLEGPTLIVANHNSHLDTAVLYSLFPLYAVHQVGAVAAHDYWFSKPYKAFFSKHFMNLVPLKRHRDPGTSVEELLKGVIEALEKKQLVIFFPEGSRGEPERLAKIKRGIDFLAERIEGLKIQPIFLHGLGKAMPRGDPIIVPFFCDVVVGEPLVKPQPSESPLSTQLEDVFLRLKAELKAPQWD